MPRLRRRLGLLLVLAAYSCRHDSPTTPPGTSFKKSPCGIGDTLILAVAQAARIDCSNGGTTLTLAANGASYVIVPQFATGQASNVRIPFSISYGTATVASASADQRSATDPPLAAPQGIAAGLQSPITPTIGGGLLPAILPSARQFAFDQGLRARGRRFANSGTRPSFQRQNSVGRPSAVVVPPVGSMRSFHVLSSFTPGTPQFKTVRAQLAHAGNNILLYIDSLAPPDGFTADQLTRFGQYIDQTLYPIGTTTFGPPSDIDQNGHVIMLMTPVVNADTPSSTCASSGYVAGFFDPGDFNGTTDPNSNQGEVFYSIVPDPSGTVSCPHTVAAVGTVLPGTFLHELQHLINYSQHVAVSGGQAGASWLDEGLSIVAEELGAIYFEQKCPPPTCRTNPTQLFPDSAQGFVQSFLYDSYQFALKPDTASLTLNEDSGNGFAWRGGDWAFVRWLGDQSGSAVYGRLERGPSNGIADIEQATGQTFPSLLANFGLALYTDSLPGLPRTTAPAVNRFSTRNMKQLWARLFATSGPSQQIPRPNPLLLAPITTDTTAVATMVPGTMSFFRLDTPIGKTTVTIRFAPLGSGTFASALHPQLIVFRLPAGQ
ncbi:MAG TPA: hypothetical protein VHE78_18285 [Gemmatimonadaceae bacterium]|nr:hypothetical protein [Gemmatimonadaceae bacterium]